MEPLVSILIPAYNSAPWVAESIRSALDQTWARKEIIIIDDGSVDRTFAIAQQFAASNVMVLTQENRGVCAARNRASELAQGDYIQWLDADDLLAPDKIEKQLQVARGLPSKGTLLSGAWGSFMYRVSNAKFRPTPLWSDLTPVEWLVRKMGRNLHMQTATWLVTRELTEAAGPWDTRILRDNDGEYFSRMILLSDGIRFVPDAKVFYRTTDSTRVSHIGRSKSKIEAQFLSMELHVKYVCSLEDSERTRAACVQYLQERLPNSYPYCPEVVAKAQDLARSLGGELQIPRLRWKYAWTQPLVGYKAAKHVQYMMPQLKVSLLRLWDKLLFTLERRRA